MDGNYDVFRDGKVIGVAAIQRQGLYSRIRCRCRLEDHSVQRLTLCVGGWETDLGILVPMAGEFGLDTRLVAKRLPVGEPEFWVGKRPAAKEQAMLAPAADTPAEEDSAADTPVTETPLAEAPAEDACTAAMADGEEAAHEDTQTEGETVFVPVAEDAPFPRLSELPAAVYAEQDGIQGVALPADE